jgi:iron complex transport system substrate-binding protein
MTAPHRANVIAVFAVAAAAIAVAGCGAERAPRSDRAVARRVVTLTPSSTELVVALGARDRLVGVDEYSRAQAGVELPTVGDFLAPRIEAILGLAPDLVVLDEVQRKTADKLAAAGVRAIVLDIQGIADVRAGALEVAAALGDRAAGERVVGELDRALAELRRRAAARAARPRVLLVVDHELGGLRGLIASGPGSYLDELVALAGGDNVLAGAGQRYVKLAADRVIAAAPDVVVDVTHAASASDWAELTRVPAVAAGRVHALSDKGFVAPTPRAAEAAARLATLLYP